MDVLHVISSADRRGAQVFAKQLVDELGGAPEHRLVAMTPSTSPNPLEVPTLGKSRFAPAGFARLLRQARQADVLIAHGSDGLIHCATASALTRTPFIYRNIGDPSVWGDVRHADLRIGAPLRRATAVAALYPRAREQLIDSYRLDPERVVVIPNAVPSFPAPTSEQRTTARDRLGLSGNLDWVGFIGALSEEKGILAAIDAVADDKGLGLVVAGGGPQLDEATARAEQLAPGRVRFLGVIDDPLRLMSAIDVLVIPSRTEGIPAVAIEAGLSGLPVVATDVGGVSEVVIDGTTGILVDSPTVAALTPALNAAIAQRESLGRVARQHCEERFTIEAVADAWRECIQRVTA